MKIRITVSFSDKVTYQAHKVGEVIDFPDQRANEAIERGLAVPVAEPKKTEAAKTTTRKRSTAKK